MSTVKITCNCNFKKVEDVSSNVKKVFKMFESYFVKEDSPINKDSEIECIYIYKDLSVDNLRVFKKIAESNKTMLNLSNIEIIEEEPEPKEDEPKDEPKEEEPEEEDELKEDEPKEYELKEDEPKEDEQTKEESLDDEKNSESDNGDIGDCLEINYESSDNEEEKVENDNIQNILKDLNILTERLNRLAEKELLD